MRSYSRAPGIVWVRELLMVFKEYIENLKINTICTFVQLNIALPMTVVYIVSQFQLPLYNAGYVRTVNHKTTVTF